MRSYFDLVSSYFNERRNCCYDLVSDSSRSCSKALRKPASFVASKYYSERKTMGGEGCCTLQHCLPQLWQSRLSKTRVLQRQIWKEGSVPDVLLALAAGGFKEKQVEAGLETLERSSPSRALAP